MESIIALIFLVAIFGLIERFSKGAKRGARSGRGASPQPSRPAAQSLPQAVKAAAPAVKSALEEAVSAFLESDEDEKPDLAHLPLGESVEDHEGCVGGSLGAHAEEGESRQEHEAHLRRQEQTRETAPMPQAAAFRRLDAAEMRRAVILSEILDKPKALRRR